MKNTTTTNHIYKAYFNWLFDIINTDSCYSQLNYTKLLDYLYHIEFKYSIPHDANRASDGISLRYVFGEKNGYEYDFIKESFSHIPCTMLEMMIGLACRIEIDIMSDYHYGNRENQWFWNMITSLNLGSMDDRNFSKKYVDDCLERFFNRDYSPNGNGGLFTVSNPPEDLRKIEIWTQAMWFLNDICDFRL